MQETVERKYPVGGPREPVYALMRGLGFTETKWSDKFWYSPDGIEVSIYGAGALARVTYRGDVSECDLDDLTDRVNAIRKQ